MLIVVLIHTLNSHQWWFMSVSDFCSLTSHYCTSNSSTYYTLILVDIVPDHSPSGGAFCNTVELGMKIIISPKKNALPFRVLLKICFYGFSGLIKKERDRTKRSNHHH